MRSQAEPFHVRFRNPGDRQIEASFGDPFCLGVRGKNPLVDTDSRVGYDCCLWGKPTDVAQPQRRFPASGAGSIEGARCRIQNLSCIAQQLDPCGSQFNMPAVSDKELGPELALKIAYLIGERRSGNVKSLSRPTEMQLLGDGDEVGELPKLH